MAEPELSREEVSSPDLEVAEASQPARKVELDLDDAPFLQVEEKNAPLPVEAETPPDNAADEKAARKKKLLILAGLAAGVLIVCAVAAWWFFFRAPPAEPLPPPEPEVVVVPSTPTPAGPQDIVHEFSVFVVPVNDDRKQTRFLVCKFAAITRDAAVDQEMKRQEIPLRDAVYYYLRGKDAAYLQDAHNYDAIKNDLMAVFNDYLSQGKLEDIVFESYLSR